MATDDTATVTVWSPNAFYLTRDDHSKIAIKKGRNVIPADCAGHPYLKAHGVVVRLEDMTPRQKIDFERFQEDEALAAKRAKEDADIAARRAKQVADMSPTARLEFLAFERTWRAAQIAGSNGCGHDNY